MTLTQREQAVIDRVRGEGERIATRLEKAYGAAGEWLPAKTAYRLIGDLTAMISENCRDLDARIQAVEAEKGMKPKHRVPAGRREL